MTPTRLRSRGRAPPKPGRPHARRRSFRTTRGTSPAKAANCAKGRGTVRRTRETAADVSETEPRRPGPEGPRRGPEPRKATSYGKETAPERGALTPERRGHPPERKERARKRRSPRTSPPSSTSEPTKPVTDVLSRGPDAQVRGPCTKELATCANHRPRAWNLPDSEPQGLTPDRRAPTPEPRYRAREHKNKPDKTKSSRSEPRCSPSRRSQRGPIAKGSGEKRSLSTSSACSLPSFASESIPVRRSSRSDLHCPRHEEHDPKHDLWVGA